MSIEKCHIRLKTFPKILFLQDNIYHVTLQSKGKKIFYRYRDYWPIFSTNQMKFLLHQRINLTRQHSM